MKNNSVFEETLSGRRDEYLQKLKETELVFSPFNPFYSTYFYFQNDGFFHEDYKFENEVPISLNAHSGNNPLLPLYYGMVVWNTNLNNSSCNKKLQAIANYTLNHTLKLSQGMELPYQFDYPLFGLKAPWTSGITQALASSYFIRMSYRFDDEKYLIYAEQYFLHCMKSMDEGGLLVSTPAGMEWVEEYPSTPHSYVLNGHIFAIIACVELFQFTQKEIYCHTAKQWIHSLLYHLPEYQYKSFLQHNLMQKKLSNIEYQGLYAGQFKHLHQLTKHPLFLDLFQFYNGAVNWNDFYRFYDIEQ